MGYAVQILFALSLLLSSVFGAPQFPCYFIFGDSLVDNGNNNFLRTSAKANYPPYGIDYPDGRATGRFTNGRNVVDFIAEFLGFSEPIPPFATARKGDILKGINYGSGGAGIRQETGQNLGDRISLDRQLAHHQTTVEKIAQMLGNADLAMKHLGQCLYTVGMGSNDYINNYFKPNIYQTNREYSPNQYAAVLIEQYSSQLKTLYKYGARKVAVFGLGPIGCIPGELQKQSNRASCASEKNDAIKIFVEKLKPMVVELNKDLAGARFTYVDTIRISATDSSANGFKFSNTTCCKVSTSTGLCVAQQVPCSPRSAFAFFDDFHPTEAAHMIVARRAYKAWFPSDAYPIDIYHLAQA